MSIVQGQEARLVFISTTLTRLPRTDAGQYTAAQENLAIAGSLCFAPGADAVAGDGESFFWQHPLRSLNSTGALHLLQPPKA